MWPAYRIGMDGHAIGFSDLIAYALLSGAFGMMAVPSLIFTEVWVDASPPAVHCRHCRQELICETGLQSAFSDCWMRTSNIYVSSSCMPLLFCIQH